MKSAVPALLVLCSLLSGHCTSRADAMAPAGDSEGLVVRVTASYPGASARSVALTGPYTPLAPLFRTLPVGTFFLEMATPRAGELSAPRDLPTQSRLGVGVVNQKLDRVEPIEEVVARAEAAVALLGPGRVLLNPDCGFATFADNPLASAEASEAKLAVVVEAAQRLRQKYGATPAGAP